MLEELSLLKIVVFLNYSHPKVETEKSEIGKECDNLFQKCTKPIGLYAKGGVATRTLSHAVQSYVQTLPTQNLLMLPSLTTEAVLNEFLFMLNKLQKKEGLENAICIVDESVIEEILLRFECTLSDVMGVVIERGFLTKTL